MKTKYIELNSGNSLILFKETFELDESCASGLRWHPDRPSYHFPTDMGHRIYNGRFAGKPAGSIHISHNRSYWEVRLFGGLVPCHRIVYSILNDEHVDEDMIIDHWDRNGLNNNSVNLRLATHSENQQNRKAKSNTFTGLKGVSFVASRLDKGINPYTAKIVVNGKCHDLGYFPTAELAHAAYCEAAKKHFGEFARTK